MIKRIMYFLSCISLMLIGLWNCNPESPSKTNEKITETTTPDGGSPKDNGETCTPSKSVWDKTAKKLLDTRCGQCHGAKPNYGAPNSLIDYDDLLKGPVGKRKIDRIAARLLKKTMPPIGTPQLPHNELDTLVEWGTCGKKHADHSVGFTSTANVFRAPKKAPVGNGIQKHDMLADKFKVSEHTLDLYQCFSFDAPNKTDRFIRRIETIVDDSRVLHHIVLLRVLDKNTKLDKVFRCRGTPGGVQYMYAWAPGGDPVEFPDGGVRMRSGDRFIVQIHYNNGAGVKNAADSSGIRIHYGEPKGTEYGMLVPGPHSFSVASGATKTVSSSCTMSVDTRILADMPHMHEIGLNFTQTIKSGDKAEKALITLTGWSFEFQNFYDTPTTLKKGDKLITTCTFKNTTSKNVRQGSGTKDEMCFAFMYVTPPPTGTGYCNELGEEIDYKVGKCGTDPKTSFIPIASGKFILDPLPALKGGDIPESKWVVKKVALYMNSDKYGSIQLDFKKSHILSKGFLDTTKNKMHFDVTSRLALRGPGTLAFDTDSKLSFSGDLKADSKKGSFVLENGCGDFDKSDFTYEVNGNTIVISSQPKSKSGLLKIIDKVVMTFEKID